MKKFLRSRVLVLIALAIVMVSVANCGFILYPERRGATGGKIDPAVLIMDCAWLVCFIVPGVIALAVDFATGCIYGGGMAINVEPGQKVDFRLHGAAPVDAKVAVVIESADGKQIVSTILNREVSKGQQMEDLKGLSIPAALAPGEYKLALKINYKTSASWDMHVAR